MHPALHPALPAVASPSAPNAGVHFNLGTIGPLESYRSGPDSPWAHTSKSFHGALMEVNPGLPRPARDLEAKLLHVPHALTLVVLAALQHGVAYYVICDPQEREVRSALKFASDLGRLEMGFIPAAGAPLWSAMHLEGMALDGIRERLAQSKQRRGARDKSWRDKLGLLLLDLPSLLAAQEPDARHCFHHSAMLLSGRPAHASRSVSKR